MRVFRRRAPAVRTHCRTPIQPDMDLPSPVRTALGTRGTWASLAPQPTSVGPPKTTPPGPQLNAGGFRRMRQPCMAFPPQPKRIQRHRTRSQAWAPVPPGKPGASKDPGGKAPTPFPEGKRRGRPFPGHRTEGRRQTSRTHAEPFAYVLPLQTPPVRRLVLHAWALGLPQPPLWLGVPSPRGSSADGNPRLGDGTSVLWSGVPPVRVRNRTGNRPRAAEQWSRVTRPRCRSGDLVRIPWHAVGASIRWRMTV